MRYFLLLTLLYTSHSWGGIEDLDWMVGRWAGDLGNSTLEETWNAPIAGSMVAIVRSTSHGAEDKPATTQWIEMISIIEEDGGLMLRLQQFSPEMRPRFEAQPLKMTSQGERRVTFEAIGPGGLKTITYSRPTPTDFLIDVTLSEGNKFVAPLHKATVTDAFKSSQTSSTPASVNACTQESFRQFDFWLGAWDVSTPQGQHAGKNLITESSQGCLLIENWQGAQGGSGQSYNFYNVTTGNWRQLWVSPGVVIDYSGGLEERTMVLNGFIHYQKQGIKQRFQGRWSPQIDGSVKQHLLQWNPTEEKWDDWFVGIYRRDSAATEAG